MTRFGNGCQTQTICSSIERLGLYAGASMQGAFTDTDSDRETALGGTLSLGFDFVRRVAIEAHFASAAIHSEGEPLLIAAGPLTVGARLRLGPHAPTLFSDRPQPRWAVVLGTQLGFRLPRAEGDPRHVGAVALYMPQPSVHAGLEWNWGPAQLSPSLAVLGEDHAAFLQLGLRASLRLAPSLSVDVEAISWMPASVPDEPGRCTGGTRAGLGVRGLLAQGILGFAQYSAGKGCEPTHSITLGATFAFGEYPLRKIPTAEEVGVQRLWMGMVDPVLDCNGWMLDDQSLLPLFKYGEPVPGTNLISRDGETFPVGEHFDIDRRGRLYRPNQYVALAGEHEFTPAAVREKLALPVCEEGPKHRYYEHCKGLFKTLEHIAFFSRTDGAGQTALIGQEREFKTDCLSEEEQQDPRRTLAGLLSTLGRGGGLRPTMGINTAPPSAPSSGSRSAPGTAASAPKSGGIVQNKAPAGSQRAAGTTHEELLGELSRAGVKHSPEKIVRVARKADGQIVFLEQGDSRSGLQHILERHGDDFAARGLPAPKVPDAIMKALTEGKVLGSQGQGSGRPVYQVVVDGRTQFISVTVGNNGYVVGANPTNRALVDKLLGQSE